MMQFKEGIGWKACYDDERNLYTVKTSWRGDYDLYEINEEIYSQLGKPGTNADELIAVDLWENEATREQRKKQKEK